MAPNEVIVHGRNSDVQQSWMFPNFQRYSQSNLLEWGLDLNLNVVQIPGHDIQLLKKHGSTWSCFRINCHRTWIEKTFVANRSSSATAKEYK